MTSPKILIFSGSIRTGSVNTRLAGTITKALAEKGAQANHITLADYQLPIYNGDLEEEKGVPENAKKLGTLIARHDGVVLVSPEYNGSIPPLLKNTLDWLSRDLGDTKPYQAVTYALAACSPGKLGGIRVVNHIRDTLVSVGADIITPQLCVGPAGDAFNDDDELTIEFHQKLLQNLCDTLIERASNFASR